MNDYDKGWNDAIKEASYIIQLLDNGDDIDPDEDPLMAAGKRVWVSGKGKSNDQG